MVDELIPPHENEFREKLLVLLRDKMTRENPDVMHRDAHPKQHGLVKAQFCVCEDLADNLRVGVFQPSTKYDCWIRFSNQNAPPLDDNDKDIRGAGIKLMNVPGEKLELEDGNTTSQDFVVISTPMFVTHDVKEFCKLIKALVSGKLALLWHFLWNPRSAWNLYKSNKCFTSPLTTRYWSTTPYQLGDNQVVKYSLIPPKVEENSGGTKNDPDYLRHALVKELGEKSASFDFCVQLRTHPDCMPIEDPGKRWSETLSPFIKVAEVHIPQQTFDTPAQVIYGRDMSFNPWHSLPEHKPLGGINRARRVIYNALSKFRHEKNHVPREEPTDFTVPKRKE